MSETPSFSFSSEVSGEPSQGMPDKNEWITTRHHGSAFVNTPLPYINKVIHHIQELELKIEICFQQHDYVFKEEKTPWVTKQVSADSPEDNWLSLSTKLDFEETDVSCKDGKALTLKWETEALLLDVAQLINRLEADREEAEKALELEKQLGKKLSVKMDCLSLWGLQQLPAAVQKEYDLCAEDILELQWHLDCKRHQLQQIQNQILPIETDNRKIQEDIDSMKKHSHLLEEKLNLEGEAVKDVLLVYEKASKLYSNVCCELMEIEKTMKEIAEESEKKIKSMSEETKCAETLLHQYKNELKQSEFIWTEYCMKLKETEEKIIKDEKHLEELVKQKAEIQEDAEYWNSKIEDLNNKMAAQGDESVKISDASSEVVKAVEKLKSTEERDLLDIKQNVININEALDSLKCENEELERENQVLSEIIRNSSTRKKEYESEIETICKSINKTEEQLEILNEDVSNAELSYSKQKKMYEELKKPKIAEEISFKNSELDLKKEIQAQKGVWKVVQDRIKSVYYELEENQKEKIKKVKEDRKRIEEIDGQVAAVEEKHKRKKDISKDKHEKLSYLNQRIQELDEQQEQTEQQLEEKRTIMQQQLNDTQEKFSFVSSQIAENSHTVENLKHEIKGIHELCDTKQVQMEKIEQSFADLRRMSSGVVIKEQNVQMVFNHLKDKLPEYEKKLNQEEKTGELQEIRKKKLEDSEAALEKIMKENLLAQEYQIVQNYYLKSKDLTEMYANRIRVENAMKHHQQLWALQKRLCRVLAAQQRQHGLSNQAGLARIQAASQENAQKILAVQGELSKAIQHTAGFLHSLTDGSPATDNDANNRCILDAEIKDKKSHTVQITV
ncbi:LOW QUALITY PROTEIN: coiled-coil domain-containing protein 178 [Ara ararauna]